MNWKLITLPALLCLATGLSINACSLSTGDLSDWGGEGGDENNSSGGGKNPTGGTGGTGGTDGTGGTKPEPEPLDCQEDGQAEGTPGSCEPTADEDDDNYACQECVASLCCEEFEACNASKPATACRYGATKYLDPDNEAIEGEFDCIFQCLTDLRNDPNSGYIAFDDDLDDCAAQCGSLECDDSKAGPAAFNLSACMLGISLSPENAAGCQMECGLDPLD